MKLRPILPDDNLAMRDIIQSVILEYGAPKIGTAYSDAATQAMYDHYQQPRRAYFVVEDENGTIQGGAGIGPLDNGSGDYCELQKMYFTKEARGKGVGRLLMEKCLDSATQLKYQNIYLETMDNMYEAQKLYKKVGFELIEAPLGDTGHFSCPVQMIKTL
jgi:putative acetyltransferase